MTHMQLITLSCCSEQFVHFLPRLYLYILVIQYQNPFPSKAGLWLLQWPGVFTPTIVCATHSRHYYVICLFSWHKTRHSLDWDFPAFLNTYYVLPERTACSQTCYVLLSRTFQPPPATAPGSALGSSTSLTTLCNRREVILLSTQTFHCNNSCTLCTFKDAKKPDSNSSQTQPNSKLCTRPYEI